MDFFSVIKRYGIGCEIVGRSHRFSGQAIASTNAINIPPIIIYLGLCRVADLTPAKADPLLVKARVKPKTLYHKKKRRCTPRLYIKHKFII